MSGDLSPRCGDVPFGAGRPQNDELRRCEIGSPGASAASSVGTSSRFAGAHPRSRRSTVSWRRPTPGEVHARSSPGACRRRSTRPVSWRRRVTWRVSCGARRRAGGNSRAPRLPRSGTSLVRSGKRSLVTPRIAKGESPAITQAQAPECRDPRHHPGVMLALLLAPPLEAPVPLSVIIAQGPGPGPPPQISDNRNSRTATTAVSCGEPRALGLSLEAPGSFPQRPIDGQVGDAETADH